jgi:hypothetical protein
MTSRSDWRTPPNITMALGTFDLDPCADKSFPLAHAVRAYTSFGLSNEWFGRVWLNPPYGSDAKTWLKKLGDHGNGIALVPPRIGAKWFHDIVLEKATAILFLRGRIAFIHHETLKAVPGNDSDSCLIAYGDDNVQALYQSKLAGKIWIL